MNRLWTAGLTAQRIALILALCATMPGCDNNEAAPVPSPVQSAAAIPAPGSPTIAPEPEPVTVPELTLPAAVITHPEPAKKPGAPKSSSGTKVPVRNPQRTGPAFQLPTTNDALFKNDDAAFYMFVDRYSPDGTVSQVWQGGGYGYVRNPRTTANGEVFTKFHEGIDIAPMERDAAGEPLDIVHAIAGGTVAFVSPNAASNYGNYIVIEHPCGEDCGSFFSLYAHLRRMDTTAGTAVKRGAPIALMGHTGDGIDRRRSHVHLELCLMLSDRFNDFYAKHYKLGNPNGNWHGHNLIGLDVAAFLKAARADPGLTPADFLKSVAPYYKVRVPNKSGQELEIARRYPFLRRPGAPDASWEIAYNTAGVPLAIAPDKEPCAVPAVVWVKPSSGYHSWNTRNHLGGTGSTATLAAEGSRYQQLVTGDF